MLRHAGAIRSVFVLGFRTFEVKRLLRRHPVKHNRAEAGTTPPSPPFSPLPQKFGRRIANTSVAERTPNTPLVGVVLYYRYLPPPDL